MKLLVLNPWQSTTFFKVTFWFLNGGRFSPEKVESFAGSKEVTLKKMVALRLVRSAQLIKAWTDHHFPIAIGRAGKVPICRFLESRNRIQDHGKRPIFRGLTARFCWECWGTKHISNSIHVWYLYLHLVDVYGKCRWIYHTWNLWVFEDIWAKHLELGFHPPWTNGLRWLEATPQDKSNLEMVSKSTTLLKLTPVPWISWNMLFIVLVRNNLFFSKGTFLIYIVISSLLPSLKLA